MLYTAPLGLHHGNQKESVLCAIVLRQQEHTVRHSFDGSRVLAGRHKPSFVFVPASTDAITFLPAEISTRYPYPVYQA